jgi:2'-5' RNA ligase
MIASESALVVPVPEAEALVKPFRDRHDPSAAVGVPAHITLLYPFKPPAAIDARDLDTLRRLFARFAPLRFELARARRFPTETLYLEPVPDEPFRRMTLAIWKEFLDTPPYGGRHPDIVPHLSVARVADERQLDQVAGEFSQAARHTLPIPARFDTVALLDTASGRGETRARFALGGG